MVADFMAQARQLLADGVNAKSLDAIGHLLAEVSREPDFIPHTEMKTLHGGAWSRERTSTATGTATVKAG